MKGETCRGEDAWKLLVGLLLALGNYAWVSIGICVLVAGGNFSR